MIFNNSFDKLDPAKNENFQKLIESNIDIINYSDKTNLSSFLNSKSKKLDPIKPKKEIIKKTLKSNSLNESSIKIEQNSKLVASDENMSKSRKYTERVASKISILNLETDLNDMDDPKKTNKGVGKNNLFSAMTIDSKLAFNTSDLNFKTPINFNLRKSDNNGSKLPKLVMEQTFQSERSSSSSEGLRVNRLEPKNRNNINDLSNITKHVVNDNYVNLPLITQQKSRYIRHEFLLKSEKVYLIDKNKMMDEKYSELESIIKKEKNNADFCLQKPKFELILNKMNRKQKDTPIEDTKYENVNPIPKVKKRERNKVNAAPSVKFSQIDEKVYLEIYIPSVM